ncbi:hypothetical protein FB565_003061 [Actinoplanes lutulentus]|nr:hypothetical protein [Actinoplanes lutulentus]
MIVAVMSSRNSEAADCTRTPAATAALTDMPN